MSKVRLLSILIYAIMVVGLATLQGQLLVLAVPLIVYLGASMLYGPPQIDLEVTRNLSTERVTQGDLVEITLSIKNVGPPLENLYLEDLLPDRLVVVEGHTRTFTQLDTGASLEMTYTIQGNRGHYRLPSVRATASDHLGIFRKVETLEVASLLFILPQVVSLPNVAIRPKRMLVYPGIIPARKAGSGVEFFDVREYQPGDPLRWINNRASARHTHALFVNEFEQERSVDVGLIVDARQSSNIFFDKSLFEYVIQATATLADTFLNQGNRVGLFIYGGHLDWTFPGYGKVQRERILQSLARAEVQSSPLFEKLEYLPTRLFPTRSQLVFISALQPEDAEVLIMLRARGYQLLVISPDPIAFELKYITEDDEHAALAARIVKLERTRLLRQLLQAGIQVFEWQVDTPFQNAAQAALSRVPVWSRNAAVGGSP